MIKPTVGRIVHIREPLQSDPLAAIVTKVWSDRCINVAAFNGDGGTYALTSITLRQDDDPAPPGTYAEWMPYQRDVAKLAATGEVHSSEMKKYGGS